MAHCRLVHTWSVFARSPLSDLELQIRHNRLAAVEAFQVRLKSRSCCIVPRFPHRLMDSHSNKEQRRWLEDRSMSDVTTLPAPDLGLKETTPAAWENEQRAFLRLLTTLLATHQGQYVAVHHGRVIAEGPDQVEVAKQAYARAGYAPIYVGLVTNEPPRPVRIPSPRLFPGPGI